MLPPPPQPTMHAVQPTIAPPQSLASAQQPNTFAFTQQAANAVQLQPSPMPPPTVPQHYQPSPVQQPSFTTNVTAIEQSPTYPAAATSLPLQFQPSPQLSLVNPPPHQPSPHQHLTPPQPSPHLHPALQYPSPQELAPHPTPSMTPRQEPLPQQAPSQSPSLLLRHPLSDPAASAAGRLAEEQWTQLEAYLVSRVSPDCLAAVVSRSALDAVLGENHRRVTALCKEHRVQVDIDHVDASASAARIMRAPADAASSAARETTLWELLNPLEDGALCGAALPLVSGQAVASGESVLSRAMRLSSGARVTLKHMPISRAPALVVVGPAAAARVALLLIMRDIIRSPAVEALEVHSFTVFPAEAALLASALRAVTPLARLFRHETTCCSPPAASAIVPNAGSSLLQASVIARSTALPQVASLFTAALAASRTTPILCRLTLDASRPAPDGLVIALRGCSARVHALAVQIAEGMPCAKIGPAILDLKGSCISSDEEALLRAAPLIRLRTLLKTSDGRLPPHIDATELCWAEESTAEISRALSDRPASVRSAAAHEAHRPVLSFGYAAGDDTHAEPAGGVALASLPNVDGKCASHADDKAEAAGSAPCVDSSSDSDSEDSGSSGRRRKRKHREKRKREKHEKREKRKREKRERGA